MSELDEERLAAWREAVKAISEALAALPASRDLERPGLERAHAILDAHTGILAAVLRTRWLRASVAEVDSDETPEDPE